MSQRRLSLALTFTIVGFSAKAYGHFRILAVDGNAPSRGAGVFAEGLGVPALSDTGQAVFPSNLRDNGTLSGGGIFRSDGSPGSPQTLILNGDPTPDVNGNIGQANQSPINLNNQDELAIAVDLTNTLGGASDHTAIYRTDATGSLTQIARLGEPVPANDGNYLSFSPIALNDSGQVAFLAILADTSDNEGLYRGDGTATAEIVRIKRPAPGTQITFQILDLQRIALNASGQVLFSGTGSDGAAQQIQGIFRGDGSSTVTIARQGTPPPDGNGTYLLLATTLASFNDAGQSAFISVLLNTTAGAADNQAIFRGDGTTTVTIAHKGELVPDQNGRYLEFTLTPVMNNQGEVLFPAAISGAAGGSNEGLFIADGTNAKAIARINDAAPGGGRFSDFGEYALNDEGQAAFHANIDLEDGGGTNDTFGLFFYDPADGLKRVARKDQNLAGLGPMGNINFAGAQSSPTDALNGINDNGEVAFQAFAGEHVAVAVWDPASTTTTTSTTLTTTSTTTTTTTLGEGPPCAQPITGHPGRQVALRGRGGGGPTASDCLFILRTAVGSETCLPACICDPSGDDNTTATDALVCLKKAVGQNVALNCPCQPSSSTTTVGGPTTTVVGPTTTIGGPTK